MNLQCHIMTFEETLRNAQVIDKLDDQRREKMFGLIKWLDDEVRTYLIDYSAKCREQLRISNSEIEEKLMRENKEKLKNKKRQD